MEKSSSARSNGITWVSTKTTMTPDFINNDYIQKMLQAYFKQPDLKLLSMEIKPGSKEGDNHLGQIIRMKIVASINGSDKNLSIIGKVTPNSPDLFTTEANCFEKLFKKFQGKNLVIPESIHVDYDHSIIFMEDLLEKEYIMPPDRKFLSYEQAVLATEALASFHGQSYKVLKDDPSLKETFGTGGWSSTPSEFTIKWFNNSHRALERNVDSYGISKDWCDKLRGVEQRLKNGFLKVCDFQEDHLNFLLHGDPWINNMLFHYTGSVPDGIKLVDYQFVSNNCFATDLNTFVFTSLTADMVVNKLDTILEIYYNKLKEVAPEIPGLSLDRIRKEFEERLFFGLVMVLTFRSVVVCSETPPDMDKIMSGQIFEKGHQSKQFISDLKIFLAFFEKAGVF